MANYMIYATRQQEQNSTGFNGVIVDGTDESDARANAAAAAPDGETKIGANWAALQLNTSNLGQTIWIEGRVIASTNVRRGS